MTRVDLTEDQLRAVLGVVGPAVSADEYNAGPLAEAETALDLALMETETAIETKA